MDNSWDRLDRKQTFPKGLWGKFVGWQFIIFIKKRKNRSEIIFVYCPLQSCTQQPTVGLALPPLDVCLHGTLLSYSVLAPAFFLRECCCHKLVLSNEKDDLRTVCFTWRLGNFPFSISGLRKRIHSASNVRGIFVFKDNLRLHKNGN